MATLPESPTWHAGIYQLEPTDPVLGGEEGISNLQAKQLADRTKWLADNLSAAGGGGGLLAAPVEYSVSTTYTTTSPHDTWRDVDDANLLITFTTTAAGRGSTQVLMTLCAAADTSGGSGEWGLRDGSNLIAFRTVSGQGTAYACYLIHLLVTGLQPETEYTLKWAFRNRNTSFATRIYVGGSAGVEGSALMEVWAA